MTVRWVPTAAPLALLLLCNQLAPPRAAAEPAPALVDRLVRGAKLSPPRAAALVDRASRALAQNAAAGGDEYDRVRQSVGVALFGAAGPGETLELYQARLSRVLGVLSAGLDVSVLEALFTPDYDTAACREDLRLSAADCKALAAAARAGDGERAAQAEAASQRDTGRALYGAGRYVEALKAYGRAAELEPGHAGSHAALGACYMQLGDVDRAAAAYEQATSLAPDQAGLYAALGHARARQGKLMAARFAYTRALELDPRHAGARAALRNLAPGRPGVGHFPRLGNAASNAKSAPAPAPASSVARGARAEADPELLARARAAVQASIAAAAAAPVAAPASGPAAAAASAPRDDFMDELIADPLRRAPPPPAAADPEAGDDSSVDEGEASADAPAEATPAGEPAPEGEAAAAAPTATAAASEAAVAAPAAAPAKPLPEVPSRETIAAVMKAVQPLLAECAPGYRGLVEVKLVVEGPSGKVQHSDVMARGLGVGQACMRAVVEVVELPPFARPSLSIGYPYRL